MPNSSLNSIAYDVTSHLWGVHSSNTRSEYFVNYRTIKHLMCDRRSFCVVSWDTVNLCRVSGNLLPFVYNEQGEPPWCLR